MTSDLHSDAAKRCSEIINLHTLSGNTGRWVAIHLSDGDSDGVVYDTWREAVKHQLHETQCCYIRIPVDGMSIPAAERYLDIHRQLYDAGFRMVDPESFKAVMPNRTEAYFNGSVHDFRTGIRNGVSGADSRGTGYARWLKRHRH